MGDTPLVKKLVLKAGYRALILNAPQGYLEQLGALPDGVILAQQPDGQVYDFAQFFIHNKSDLERDFPNVLGVLKAGGVLWIAYPKKSSKIKTDITRDVGWDVVKQAGWGGVTQISIDDIWSALRFRPDAERGT